MELRGNVEELKAALASARFDVEAYVHILINSNTGGTPFLKMLRDRCGVRRFVESRVSVKNLLADRKKVNERDMCIGTAIYNACKPLCSL